MENGETVVDGAIRETYEEAQAKIESLKPYALYNLTFINQVYLMFRARMVSEDFSPGAESLEVRLFKENEIPWDEIAFPVILQTLKLYLADRPAGIFPFHMGDIHIRY